ncbi:serine/threonine protein kinase [Kribbella kalugense]|uniref:non-specific serine/threonine protein kinase n=1 Tax=Kribbella kalugense TaxID=2512221 RepID=A0A4V3G7J3_9ACTN|nr:serine/threonine-protein kinase [Kribbella kalugense]TDW19154.1 serine/threonine protein kinase [Kribbella kalugense]
MTGRLIGGRYLLGEPLGSGGMGSVWRAHDQELDRTVALKRAHPGVDDPDGRRLRREARTGARLHDPHVVTIFDVVSDGDEHWLVLEYLPSRSLDELGPLPADQVARIGVQIASALQAVHAAGIIHRDLKPANILVTPDGTAKLADFGISRRMWAEATLTDSSTVGTPANLAPEVANGNEPTTASDVFSLGAVLYAALEGHSPFGSDPNPLAVLRRAARGELEPLRRGGELTPLITRMLAIDPQDRPSVAEVVEELGGAAPLSPPRRKRWVIPAAAGGVVVAVVLSVLIGRAVSGSSEPSGSSGPSAPSTAPTSTVPTPTSTVPTPTSGSATAPAAGPVGDPLTVDPCALIDEKSLSRFGQTTLEPAYGNFDRCDVVVTGTGDQEVDVRAELNLPYTDSPRGAVQKFTGNLRTVTREKSGGDDCERVLVLSDRTQIQVEAKHTDGSGMDVCAMAEAVTQKAIGVLQAGPIPRRTAPLPATSLAQVDACTLLDKKALAVIPGVGPHPDTSFGNWSCGWDGTTSDLSVDLYFDRNQPLDSSDGQPITVGGRSAFLSNENDGPKTCAVVIVYRTYVDPNGQDAVELVTMSVGGSAKPASLCGLATKLAQAAVLKLPKA